VSNLLPPAPAGLRLLLLTTRPAAEADVGQEVPCPAASHLTNREAAVLASSGIDVPVNRGWTPREFARLIRVCPDQVRNWIRDGTLGAINVARHRYGKPRFVILPEHLGDFTRKRAAARPRTAQRRRKALTGTKDYYPECW